MLPALVAGGSALLGFLGANKSANQAEKAADRTYEANMRIHEDNLAAQKQAREDSMAWAAQLLREGRLGQTDETGSRTYFDPERGWVTELSPMQERLLQMFQQEQARQLGKSTQRIEDSEMRGMRGAREAEEVIARELQRQQYDQQPRDPSRLAQLLFARGQQARNEVMDRNDAITARTMIERGNMSPAATYAATSERARATAQGAAQDRINAELAARQQVNSEQEADRQYGSRLFQQFMPARTYSPQIRTQQPQGPGRTGDASNFGSQLVSAASQAPNAPMIEPNFAGAEATATKFNALTGGLNSLAGFFQQQQSNRQLADALKGL